MTSINPPDPIRHTSDHLPARPPVGFIAALPATPIRPANGRILGDLGPLLAETARGDQDAFAELYRVTSTRVYSQAMRILRTREHTDEVTQEVYLQIWQQAARYDQSRGCAWSWIRTMTHRRAVDRVRAAAAARTRDHLYSLDHQDPERDDVWAQVAAQSAAGHVRVALNQLTFKQRQAITLTYLDGLTNNEVAATLGVATATVKTRIRDGLTKLRTALPAPS